MNVLANMKIKRKMVLLAATGSAGVICIGGLCLWGVASIRLKVEGAQFESGKMMAAQHIGSDLGVVNAVVGHIALSRDCGNCHATSAGGNREEQARIAQECRNLLNGLMHQEKTTEGQKLVSDLEKVGIDWLDANAHVLAAGLEGRSQEALALYRTESIPNVGPAQHALASYLNWEQPRLAESQQQADTITRMLPVPIAVVSLLVLAASALAGMAVTGSIAKPLTVAVNHLREVAEGDVSRDVPREYLDRADEIGGLSKALQTMSASLRKMMREVTGGISVLTSSSAELSASSSRLSAGAQNASDKAHSVAAATEEMSANVMSVAAGMEQTNTNLGVVASSTEQMTATIGEIAENAEKARRVTCDAAQQAVRITDQVSQLGQAAQDIGKVTEAITEISSQTNLLALNATIEAARAGASGKGFAVVANEIKELAQQTAAATEDIRSRIDGMQSSTTGSIAEIAKVSQVIAEVREIVSSIAAAIEEQATVTKDISRNITEASTGVGDANTRVAQTSQVSTEVAKDIIQVDNVAREMADGSEQVRVRATDLSRLAEQLQIAIAGFRV